MLFPQIWWHLTADGGMWSCTDPPWIATCSRRVGKPPIKVVKSKGILPKNGRNFQGKDLEYIAQMDPMMVNKKSTCYFCDAFRREPSSLEAWDKENESRVVWSPWALAQIRSHVLFLWQPWDFVAMGFLWEQNTFFYQGNTDTHTHTQKG